MKTNDNGFKSLKMVMYFVLFLVALVVGLVVDFLVSSVSGIHIVDWNVADRGLWVLLWTLIAFPILCLSSRMRNYNSWEDIYK